MRILKYGLSGNDVKYLQLLLGELTPDGKFGKLTEARLKEVQKQLKLTVDGRCGPQTQKALNMNDFICITCDPTKVIFVGTPYSASNKPLKVLKNSLSHALYILIKYFIYFLLPFYFKYMYIF